MDHHVVFNINLDVNLDFDLNQHLDVIIVNLDFDLNVYQLFDVYVNELDDNNGVMIISGPTFWDTTWGRKTERYNRHHADIWKAVTPYIEGKILDLGCGQATPYIGTDPDLTGIDWSPIGLEYAQKNVPRGTFICADISKPIPLPSGQFDTVVMFGVLDYFEDWEDVLREARRMLKPGGQIVATLLNGFNGHDWKSYPHITGNWHLVTF